MNAVETELKVTFPKDFGAIIKQYDGGYPIPNKITVEGQDEVLNNLVSFLDKDVSFIFDIPFGNLFCYSFGDNTCEIVFWNHEEGAAQTISNRICHQTEKQYILN